MRPKRLIISGWGPYKNKTEIDFTVFEGRGLFLITGATGAGKTTIFDAITYALYGSLSGEMREKNSVRSDFADADTKTYVELFVSHAGKDYHIIRNPEYERPKKRGKGDSLTKEKENAVLYLPEDKVIEGTREVNAKIQEILVLDYAQFKQITMIAQGEFARLLTASPKDKTRIFRDIFGTGVYEKFTQALRARSNALYDRVKEQQSRLKEDVEMLLTDSKKEEAIVTLRELTETDNWNYAAVAEELKRLSGEAEKAEKNLQKEYTGLQDTKDALTREVTEKEQENEQFHRLEQVEQTLHLLGEQEEEIKEKTAICNRSRIAEALSPQRVRTQSARQNLEEKKQKKRKQQETIERLQAEQAELLFFDEKKDVLATYLEVCRGILESRQQSADSEKAYQSTCEKWEEAKRTFLQWETERDEKRRAYEEADKSYRHAVVGIAARMLKAGEPCPVCGSVEHPNPAKEEAGILSEGELQQLKEALEEIEADLRKAQEQAASLKALAEEQESRLHKLQDQVKALEKQEQRIKEELVLGQSLYVDLLLQGSFEEKAKLVQQKTLRLTQIAGMLQSEKEQLVTTDEEIIQGERVLTDCEEVLREALFREGFSDEEECERALLPKKEMAELEKHLSSYKEQLTSAQSIKAHLEQVLQNKQKNDLTTLYEKADACNVLLAEKQNEWKQAHAFCAEVKKAVTQFAERQKKMGKAEEEYGYVKDLDNLASGNNAKRLVFEQYVLAGYFEEILRAANLRFLKMTGGRYEMSRVEEVGDGRVKDSLEIQVMDYYTGKARSVKTLSGGESFKASLSLALGMSDVIQAMNGGIKVDTLFIDEGFGALDSESLDQACETLMGLVEHNKLIGIISHVPELRERIDSQLVVEKTNSGSGVHIQV
ncbi:MAG: AAA family ATPase [Lachnospiraceae bacterium]